MEKTRSQNYQLSIKQKRIIIKCGGSIKINVNSSMLSQYCYRIIARSTEIMDSSSCMSAAIAYRIAPASEPPLTVPPPLHGRVHRTATYNTRYSMCYLAFPCSHLHRTWITIIGSKVTLDIIVVQLWNCTLCNKFTNDSSVKYIE